MTCAGVAACLLLSPEAGFAYDHPLDDQAIREAYFLGQDVERAESFLAQYTQTLPVPETGPQVAQIELSTPYAQVVEVSEQHTAGYSAQQAAADYQKRGDFILVRVRVLFTPSYTNRADDFWRDVSVGLVQQSHMAATRVWGQAIYDSDPDGDNSWVVGADVFVQFSVAGVESDTVQVEVIPPEGAAVEAEFDLGELQ